MSRLTEEEYQKRDTLRQARVTELAPQLARLLGTAQEVYQELRPRAAHVSEVPMSHPLRHQQINKIAHALVGGLVPVSDYPMIAVDRSHSLVIYKNHENPSNPTWDLTRRLQIGPLEEQTTKVEQSGLIDVCTYTYPSEYGKNARFGRVLCDMFNNYDSAESHIDDIDADLTAALELS